MSEQRHMTVILTVEPKDEYQDPATGQWVPGSLPAPGAVVHKILDVLSDHTKHDETIGWRVTAITSAR